MAQATCSIEGCDKGARWRGLCRRHYIEDQYRDTPEPSDEELAGRILPRIEKQPDDGCWLWTGAGHARTGHGMFGYNALGRNITRYVHRFVYEYLVGPIPDGLVLDHLCRVTRCCNPSHLEPVSGAVNVERGVGPTAERARKTHCVNGHPLSGSNLYVTKRGHRHCKACSAERSRRVRTDK